MLAPRDGGIYVDATFGAGGYSRAILAVAWNPGASASTATGQAITGRFDLVDGVRLAG